MGVSPHPHTLGSRLSLNKPKAVPVGYSLPRAVSRVDVLESLLPVWYHDLPS